MRESASVYKIMRLGLLIVIFQVDLIVLRGSGESRLNCFYQPVSSMRCTPQLRVRLSVWLEERCAREWLGRLIKALLVHHSLLLTPPPPPMN